MRKSTFILIFFMSSVLISSIANAQSKFIPLDIISNFFNNILKSLGITATVTQQKVIPSSGTIVYPESCVSRCIAKGFTSGTCRNGGIG